MWKSNKWIIIIGVCFLMIAYVLPLETRMTGMFDYRTSISFPSRIMTAIGVVMIASGWLIGKK